MNWKKRAALREQAANPPKGAPPPKAGELPGPVSVKAKKATATK